MYCDSYKAHIKYDKNSMCLKCRELYEDHIEEETYRKRKDRQIRNKNEKMLDTPQGL